MDMPGGPPGGAPGAGGGGGLEWSADDSAPEEKQMTYQEFAARSGLPATVPNGYTMKDGEPLKATFNSWMQLQRVYATGAGVAVAEVEPGRVGSRLTREANQWAAYTLAVVKELGKLYGEGLNGFAFKVSYPVMGGVTVNSGATQVTDIGPMNILVIMQVRPSLQRGYGQKVYDRLKRYDCLGRGSTADGSLQTTSSPFTIHTSRGGHFRPNKLNLTPVAGAVWGLLWSRNIVRLSIKNRAGDEIFSAEQPAGQGPGILASILDPPQMYYNPKWRLLLPPEDLKFQGGRLNLNGTKGWSYLFTLNLPSNVAAQMHSASAELIGLEDPIAEARASAAGSMSINIGATGVGAGTPGGAGAGPEGMPGPEGPGGLPGGMPMPPGAEVPAGPVAPPPVM